MNPESLFFFGANSITEVTTWEQAKSWFNYGAIEIDENGGMTASIKGVNGNTVYRMRINPKQQAGDKTMQPGPG